MEVKVPQLPESVADATLVSWHRKVGESVSRDDNLVDLETDKVVLEVPAPADGVIKEIRIADGATVTSGEILAVIEPGKPGKAGTAAAESQGEAGTADADADGAAGKSGKAGTAAAESTADGAAGKPGTGAAESGANAESANAESAAESGGEAQGANAESANAASAPPRMGPAVRKLVDEHDLDPAAIAASGRDGRLTKGDVLSFLAEGRGSDGDGESSARPGTTSAPATGAAPARREQRVQMTRLRQRIAERLVAAQQTAAMLTTFNEVDMSEIVRLRKKYQEQFQAEHEIKLGFMSFFVRAVIESLRAFPLLNASVDGDEIVYHEYFDIGVAVSTERGLIVPVLRDAQHLSMGDIEAGIRDFGVRARSGEIGMDELTGGTFTITNGGIFGSLLSTPILNPPQSGILGMHAIQDRPVVVDGEIAIRPMMNLALSYDHRIVDGREAVQFLVRIKQLLEDPARLLLQI